MALRKRLLPTRVEFRASSPYTAQCDRITESMNRPLLTKAKTALKNAGMKP